MTTAPSRVPTFGVGLAVAVLFGTGALAWHDMAAQSRGTELVTSTYEVTLALDSVAARLVETEDAYRAYVDGRDAAKLSAAKAAGESARARLVDARASATASGTPAELGELGPALDRYLATLAKASDLPPASQRAEVAAITEARLALTDRITRIIADEARLRAEHEAKASASREATARAMLASSLLGGFLLVFSFALLARENKARAVAEARALARERELETTLSSIGDAVVVTDERGVVVDVNAAAEALTKRTRKQARGQAIGALLDLDEAEAAGVKRALESGQPLTLGAGHAATDTSVRYAGTLAAIRTEEGEVLGLVGVLRDAEAARREERRFRRIVESGPDAIVIAKPDGTIWHVNDRLTELFGYARDELEGAAIEKLLPERFRKAHVAHRTSYHATPSIRAMGQGNLRLLGRRKDGVEFPAAISLAPIEMADGAYAIAAIRDITEQITAAQALRHAKEQAEVANRELEAFSYSVAHDLRAPLRSIDGFSHAILEDYGPSLDDTGKEYLGLVRQSARHMAELIDDLLALSRVARTELHREKVDLAEKARAVAAELSRREPGRAVTFVVPDSLPGDADPRLVTIALENLMGNAFKFSARAKEPTITVGSVERDGELVYFVRDNGAGFDMAHASRLFTPFQRLHADKDYEGTGIGLATVQRIITRHGGRIWAEAKVGEGATFFFTLG